MLPPWPSRHSFAKLKAGWGRIPPGSLPFPNCDRNKWSWYCGQFSDAYFDMHKRGLRGCVLPSGVLNRSDVRLILDVSGGTAAFAEAVQDIYGDRLVTLTTNIFASELEQAYDGGIEGNYEGKHNFPPIHEANGLRGFASLTADLYSFLPFGEYTMDVLHTRWAYHTGFPRASLFGFQRVLRPGGWLIIRQMRHAMTAGSLTRVVAQAGALGWRYAQNGDGNLTYGIGPSANLTWCGDSLLIFQMPVPSYWPDEFHLDQQAVDAEAKAPEAKALVEAKTKP